MSANLSAISSTDAIAPSDAARRSRSLTKRFGATQALAGLDLAAPAGSILGVLGPNGAGKTTAVRILTTLALPDAGRARVAGHDVVRDPAAVRRNIGVAAQAATLDETLTGRQNLMMVGQLSQMRTADARARAGELLATFELIDADDGATVLLTTQYLDEADQLADRIAVVDHGRVVAEGTPAELKRLTGGARLEATLARADAAALDGAGIDVEDVAVHQPSLDDVFMRLTGAGAAPGAELEEVAG